MEQLLQYLRGFGKLNPECLAYLQKIVKSQKLRKKDVLLKFGEVNERIYFIKKGLLYSFYYVGKQEVPDWFFGANHMIVSVSSFYDQSPSKAVIEAVYDCDLLYITKQEFDYLCATFHDFSIIANQLFPLYL